MTLIVIKTDEPRLVARVVIWIMAKIKDSASWNIYVLHQR